MGTLLANVDHSGTISKLDGKATAGLSAPLKNASLGMTNLWEGEQRQMLAPFARDDSSSFHCEFRLIGRAGDWGGGEFALAALAVAAEVVP